MKIEIDIANEGFTVPSETDIIKWLQVLFAHPQIKQQKKIENKASLSLCMVDFPEIQALNKQYRQKDKPTNVLSFPCPIPNAPNGFLGDIVLCVPQIEKEANEQHKSYTDHFAHLILHSTLHLLGYDHEVEHDAIEMETLEIELLALLDISNPYGALHE